MALPLQGIKVLDLSRVLAGPFCTQVLTDYGAEVIKIEDPHGGDPARYQPPLIEGVGALFYLLNRNKKSISLDLRQREGQEIFKKLALESDVVIEQFRPGVMDRLGLDYETLRQINPGLIYCALSGFGQNGPLRESPGHDLNFQSLAGMALLNGIKGQKPVVPPLTMAALAGGSMYAVTAILMALFQREKSGQGQFCDVSILDGAISFMVQPLADWAANGNMPQRGESLLGGAYACYNIYQTQDGGYVSLAAVEGKFWQEFCIRMGYPEYSEQQWNLSRQEGIYADIQAQFLTRKRDEWEQLFSDSGFCFSPLLNLEEICVHPQILARDLIKTIPDFRSSNHSLHLTGLPFVMSESPGEIHLIFSELGQHNQEVLGALGYRESEILDLKSRGII
ncbi:CaiB/BaiF CoA transferase family protein [Syntrophomonas palmitatica]|uniref:CaiB/BaiF CoA transferase family protein n=1 Tax=Syntrophomonas palmitatica TaxID=402877 RepID=UPI0006CFDB2D|nr:CaiB/BaiF CoA-transferase family protein [Syntrophomonas palmitatica]